MLIATFYEQGSPGLEVSLGVDHSQALVEAIAQRVLSLCEQDRYDEISNLDDEIINCSIGGSIGLKIFGSSDGLIQDLQGYHDSTVTAIDALLDGRHNSKRSKWRIDARERLRLGKTALGMADVLRAVQAAQDGDIIEEIEALGVYEGPHPDGEAMKSPFKICLSDSKSSNSQVCLGVTRRHRHSYCSH